jgi:CoA:oxalate CoA-transferase
MTPDDTPHGPLSGLTVVDLTRILAGPYATMLLADLGARVIKVELPGQGDDTREVGPFIEHETGGRTSAYFASVNRNKESIALDLKAEADRAIFERLLDRADVLVENFRPGVMHKLGYGWEAIHARWPRLVMASISGFGQTGPYRELHAYDMVVQAMSGVMSITGPEGGPPVRVGVSIGDLAAGMFGAIGIQSALLERVHRGRGRHVDVAMFDGQVALLENALARLQVEGRPPGPIGTRHPSITPFAVFQAREGALVIAAGNDAMFGRLCNTIARPGLPADPRFARNGERSRHHEALRIELEQALQARPAAEWVALLREAGIACGPLNDVAALRDDPQVRARHMLVDLPLPGGGALAVAGCPVKFADAPAPRLRAAPQLDQHRGALLAELGLAPA